MKPPQATTHMDHAVKSARTMSRVAGMWAAAAPTGHWQTSEQDPHPQRWPPCASQPSIQEQVSTRRSPGTVVIITKETPDMRCPQREQATSLNIISQCTMRGDIPMGPRQRLPAGQPVGENTLHAGSNWEHVHGHLCPWRTVVGLTLTCRSLGPSSARPSGP